MNKDIEKEKNYITVQYVIVNMQELLRSVCMIFFLSMHHK